MKTVTIADCPVEVNQEILDLFPELNMFRSNTDSSPEIILPKWEKSSVGECRTFVYRWFCREALWKGILPFHGSALKVHEHAHIFIGPSGAGKSTHARIWRETFPDCVRMINDDRPFLKFSDTIRVYGSPWMGKHGIGQNTNAELKSICVIKQGKRNVIRRIEKVQAFSMVLRQCFPFSESSMINVVVEMAHRLVECIPVWELTCRIDRSAAELSFLAMEGESC